MGGWDWGFKSTPKKAAAKAKPVSPAAAEAAEIDEIKRKAAAEVKAEQEEGSVSSASEFLFLTESYIHLCFSLELLLPRRSNIACGVCVPRHSNSGRAFSFGR